jgi:PPOX class probable F420-dependent enzyme
MEIPSGEMSAQRSRVTAITDFIYLRLRHRDAWSSATASPEAHERGFESLRDRKYCLLTTFRKNGEPMPTPVWFGLADGKVYLRSEAAVGKVKRIRNDPRVRLAPSTIRGKPLGAPAEGVARILPAGETDVAERAIAANYGPMRRVYEGIGNKLPSVSSVYIEVAPATNTPKST